MYLMPNPNRTIPMVSKEYQILMIILLFLSLLLILRVDHEKKRRNSIERSRELNILEVILGIVVVLGVFWLALSTAETLVEIGSVVDGSGVEYVMFNAGFDCGDTMVWKDILEWGAGEISCWGGGNWIDEKVHEIRNAARSSTDKAEGKKRKEQEETPEEREKRTFSKIKASSDWLVGDEEDDLQDLLKIRHLNRDYLKGKDVI